MPELPPSKRRPPLPQATNAAARRPYAELHCKTNFSFLTAGSHPDELVGQAAALGYRALAITDHQTLAGVVRAHVAAQEAGLKLLVGAEIAPRDAPSVVLLACDRAGYGRLSRLLTVGRTRAPKGECHLQLDDVADHAEGLLACIPLAPLVDSPAAASLAAYREIFGDRAYVLAELHRGPDDARRLQIMLRQARRQRLPVAAANDVHYHVPERRPLQDVLTAIRVIRPVAEITELLFANAERHLKPADEMAALFADAPGAFARTIEIADRLTFSLDELRYEYPQELSPPGLTPFAYLHQLTWQGAGNRYPQGVPDKVRRLVEHELKLIEELHYEAYFLTVWDLIRFARGQNILCQGRGSAANSAVCYCLGVTSVDPDRSELLFERFISRERNEAPDIDLDFEHERREEVLQYVYEKYGRERAGMTAEVISYRPRSAVRDVGRALGIEPQRINALAKALGHPRDAPDWMICCQDARLDPHSLVVRQWLGLVGQLLGFPRHLSQHVGGMVMTRGPLCELVPIENAAMPGRTVIEWDKDDLDALGILKVDCLALGMLTAIRKCFGLLKEHAGLELTLANIPAEDPQVYQMASRADTIGVFQIESRAQMSMLPRLKPKCFYDLVIEVALVRPGPIQGNMVHPYLQRRASQEAVTYPNQAIQRVLHRTLGVPIFQEQAMQLAIVAAGFTPGEADQLRRAMGAWRRPGLIDQFHQKLIAGMQENGLTAEFAEQVFRQIRGFGEYGFPESHAASFALLVYVSAWLKCHHPAAFCAAIINSQPMGFYAPAQLVRDAREHGVEVRPINVNHSGWDCTLEAGHPWAVRLGLRMLKGMPQRAGEAVARARAAGEFRSWQDFVRRTGLRRPELTRLAKARALDSLGLDRRHGVWQALGEAVDRNRPLFAGMQEEEEREASLPGLSDYEEVLADYQTAGLTLNQHPMAFFREQLNARRCLPAAQLPAYGTGRTVRVAGIIILRQRPSTARGIIFMTLEDETGIANLVVRPHIWQRFHHVAGRASAVIVQGQLQYQKEDGVLHVIAQQFTDIATLSRHIPSQSRDFH